jgi:hypothetical protein
MPAVHKLIITRPSLDSLHIDENTLSRDSSKTPSYVTAPGFISQTYEELITWEELKNRKSELLACRPDLYDQIDQIDIFGVNMLQDNGTSLLWNPLVLPYTIITTFDTVEHAILAIDAFFTNEVIDDIKQKIEQIPGTTVTEELWVDGVKDETYNPGRF